MQNTTNYNFNLPEGTDLWNYLTQTNPNFTALDSILKGVSDATVTTATEVASGTAHAISRTLPDANVIRFTATSNWTLGDTMTIDGTPVTVVKPNGTNLQTGDYVIGAEVLGVIRATQFTVYVGGGSSTMDAEDVDYDNTVSGLTATDVQAAIDEEAAAINTINSNLSNLLSNLYGWNLVGSVTGINDVAIDPTEYNEFYVTQAYMDNSVNRVVSYIIPSAIMTPTSQSMYNGFSYSTSTGKMVIGYSNTSIRNGSFIYEGSERISNCIMTVYGR